MQREVRSVRLCYDPTSRTYSGHPDAQLLMAAFQIVATAANGSLELFIAKRMIGQYHMDELDVMRAEWCEHATRNASYARCTSMPCCPFCDSPLTQVQVQTITERDQHGTLTMVQTSILQMLTYVYKRDIHVLRCCTPESAQAECTCQQESPFQNLTNL